MSAVQGRLIAILVGAEGSEKKLLGTLSHKLKIDAEMQDATTKDSDGGWAEVIPGEKSGSVSVSGVYDPEAAADQGANDMLDILIAGTKVHCIYGPEESGDITKEFDAYIQSFEEDAPIKDRTTYSIELKITGPVTPATVA